MPPPEYPVNLPGVFPLENQVGLSVLAPPENKLDDYVMTPLLTSDYDSNNECDNEEAGMSKKNLRQAIHPQAMPLKVRNVYNIRPRYHTDYVKGKIDCPMLFTQVGNNFNKDVLVLLQKKGIENSEQNNITQ